MSRDNKHTQRVLVVTPDTLGPKMAGPAIRAFEIAKALRLQTEVTLVSTVASTLETDLFPAEFANERRLRELVASHDVLVFQGHTLSSFPWIVKSEIIIVADIYDPMHLEILEQGKDLTPEQRIERTLSTVEVLNTQLDRADYMICASEKQRDLWLGQLAALCRINPLTYDADSSLRNLIDIAPFGIQNENPAQSHHGIKGTVPGITQEDQVILWGGGIYNWFDPLTLIRAVGQLSTSRPNLKLFFLGVQHPNPDVPAMQMVTQAMRLADELELTDRHVFFNKEWVNYNDRANYLLDADLGVSTHFPHVETEFSFRTRILDYLWAGIPTVSTSGDTFAKLIDQHELGIVVPPENVEALALGIDRALYDDEAHGKYRENVASFRESMRWETTLQPLVNFCTEPHHAADFGKKIISPRENHRRHLAQRIENLETSTFWLLTKPLRGLVDFIGRRNH